MNKKAAILIDMLELSRGRTRNLCIVETGTIRKTGERYEVGDGHSTLYIAMYLSEIDRSPTDYFASIDIDTTTARSYLKDKNLLPYVTLVSGNSVDKLPHFKNVTFAYLDSANDAQLTLEEFMIVWPNVVTGGCVMVDDCNELSAELHKGDMLLPYLRENGISYVHYETNQIAIWK